jgi:hypothetical protein
MRERSKSIRTGAWPAPFTLTGIARRHSSGRARIPAPMEQSPRGSVADVKVQSVSQWRRRGIGRPESSTATSWRRNVTHDLRRSRLDGKCALASWIEASSSPQPANSPNVFGGLECLKYPLPGGTADMRGDEYSAPKVRSIQVDQSVRQTAEITIPLDALLVDGTPLRNLSEVHEVKRPLSVGTFGDRSAGDQ